MSNYTETNISISVDSSDHETFGFEFSNVFYAENVTTKKLAATLNLLTEKFPKSEGFVVTVITTKKVVSITSVIITN